MRGAIAGEDILVEDDGGELWNAVRVTAHTAAGATPPTTCAADWFVFAATTAMLAAAHPDRVSVGLNGLPPNTDLLADPAIRNAPRHGAVAPVDLGARLCRL